MPAENRVDPPCPYSECRRLISHRHAEEGGIHRTYGPSATAIGVTTVPAPGIILGPRADWAPREGMWVKVWAAVTRQSAITHPDDVTVELESHNESYSVSVRRDRVLPSDDSRPATAPRCTSLYETDEGPLVHCESYSPPGHQHRTERPAYQWDDAQAYGHVEVC